jgi:predicted kinase
MVSDIIQSINSSAKTLYILCGLPYSGKTYLASKIIAETGCAYVSIDAILKDLGYDWDTNNLPDEQGWKQVFDASYQKSRDALKEGLNVLYDSTNHTKASRNALRAVARDVGATANVIYVNGG